MKRKRYADEQIAFALRQAESGTSVEDVCRKLGVSEATFYRWKKQFAGMRRAMSSASSSMATPALMRRTLAWESTSLSKGMSREDDRVILGWAWATVQSP